MVQSDQCPPCLWIYLSVSQNYIIDKDKNDLLSAQLDRKDQRVTFSPVAKGISFSADSCDKKKKNSKRKNMHSQVNPERLGLYEYCAWSHQQRRSFSHFVLGWLF